MQKKEGGEDSRKLEAHVAGDGGRHGVCRGTISTPGRAGEKESSLLIKSPKGGRGAIGGGVESIPTQKPRFASFLGLVTNQGRLRLGKQEDSKFFAARPTTGTARRGRGGLLLENSPGIRSSPRFMTLKPSMPSPHFPPAKQLEQGRAGSTSNGRPGHISRVQHLHFACG